MINLDEINQKREILAQKFNDAVKNNDTEAFNSTFLEFTELIQNAVLQEARNEINAQDVNILSARGVRQLTSEENTYYQLLIDAMRSPDPKQALANLDVVMPKTTIDAVFEDLQQTHPLLDAIQFMNTSGLIEIILNTNTKQTAAWGPLTAEITKELSSGFKKQNLEQNKLSAWIPVAKAMLDLGPTWLDRYVRTVLGEALAFGLEDGIINGTGKNQPIGMIRQIGDDVAVVSGEYPEKTPVKVTSLDQVSYGQLLSRMAKTPNGNYRTVTEVILVVNPVDYLRRIMPSTTILRPDGTYAGNVFPFPTKVIQSAQMAEGKAVIGLAKRYFMGIGTAKSGKIEYSDEYKFLEDERTYLVKLYGHGQALDDNAFVLADITGIQPTLLKVRVVDGAEEAEKASLSALTIGACELAPEFGEEVTEYTTTTSNTNDAITATATDESATVEIKVNGTAIPNKSTAKWSKGENKVVIAVSNGMDYRTYTVTVTKS